VNQVENRAFSGGTGWAVVASSLLAIAISTFVIWLTYGRGEAGHGPVWIGSLAAVAAAANSACAIALVLGWRAIRRGDQARHRNYMLSAVTFSAVFFISYVVRHYYHGDTPFDGTGLIRAIYLAILATHILGSMIVLVLLPLTLIFVGRQRFDLHRAVNRWFVPIWLYVSVTGVVIYFMLR
jgi:putative membrane protein